MAFDITKPEYQAEILSQPIRDNFVALKTQLDVEHNENGTHKDALKKSGDISIGDLGIKKSVPALRLIGSETSATDLRVVESVGYFKIQKNLATENSPVWSDIFSINPSNCLISIAKINHNNLDSSTQIPDTRLAQIATANKVADSALSVNIPRINTLNTFTQAQIVQGSDAGLYFINNTDTTYKAEFKKDSDATAKILIKNQSDGIDVASYSFGADGNLATKKLTASTQIVSNVATGTPPLVVNSTTMVNNLFVAKALVANSLTNVDAQIYEWDIAGTYTLNRPTKGAIAFIECWGAGAGGCSYPIFGPTGLVIGTKSVGGFGGAYSFAICLVSSLPDIIPITVGTAGIFTNITTTDTTLDSTTFTPKIAANRGTSSSVGSFCKATAADAPFVFVRNGYLFTWEANTVNATTGSIGFAIEAGGLTTGVGGPTSTTNSGGGGGSPLYSSGGTSINGGDGGANGNNGMSPAGGGGYGANGAAGKVRITIW